MSAVLVRMLRIIRRALDHRMLDDNHLMAAGDGSIVGGKRSQREASIMADLGASYRGRAACTKLDDAGGDRLAILELDDAGNGVSLQPRIPAPRRNEQSQGRNVPLRHASSPHLDGPRNPVRLNLFDSLAVRAVG